MRYRTLKFTSITKTLSGRLQYRKKTIGSITLVNICEIDYSILYLWILHLFLSVVACIISLYDSLDY